LDEEQEEEEEAARGFEGNGEWKGKWKGENGIWKVEGGRGKGWDGKAPLMRGLNKKFDITNFFRATRSRAGVKSSSYSPHKYKIAPL
jgi:hypothetical protein